MSDTRHPEPAKDLLQPTMHYYTYITTNKYNAVFYTGITNNLHVRMQLHIGKRIPGFTARYNVNKLVWYEVFKTPQEAIAAEKRIKGWRREKKIALIQSINPGFRDLLKDVGDPSQAQDDMIERGGK